MELAIQSEQDAAVHISVSGRITQDQVAVNADPLRELLGADVYSRNVLLNMRNAEFMDSSGVSWLLISHKRFKENDGRMVLYNVPPIVSNVLKVLRMHLVFNLAADEDAAEALLRGNEA